MSICTVMISGTAVEIQEGSLQIKDRVDDKISATFTVIDATGTAAYIKGQPVTISDSVLGTLFTGYINKPTCTNAYPNATNYWSMDCVNKFVVAARKTTNTAGSKKRGGKHKNQPAGAIVANQIQEYLAPDGITGNFGLDWSELQTDWASGTLTGTTAATNTSTGNEGAGDLELAPAGVGMTFVQQTQADFSSNPATDMVATANGVMLNSTAAIMLQATCGIPNLSNAALYVKVWSGSYTIAAIDQLNYDIWISSDSPEKKAAVDFVLSDGTTFRDSINLNGTDSQGLGMNPGVDLSGVATNTWYHRTFFIDGAGSWVGKTISYVSVAFAGASAGNYTAYFRNVYINNDYGATHKLDIFSATATATQATPQTLQNNGYTGMSCTVVTAYNTNGFMETLPFSLTTVGIVQSSQVSWVVDLPSSDCVFLVTATIDGFATFLPCVSGEPIPNLIAGMNTAGMNLQLTYSMFNNGPDPTLTPVLTSVQGTVISAYSCPKSDIIATTKGTWTSGTLSNLNLSSTNTLQLNGYARSWVDANDGSQTLYGTTSPAQGILTKQFYLSTGSGTDARSRLDFAGSAWQNFTMECDVTIPTASTQMGFVYRTTGWQNNNNTFAYMVAISTTSMQMGKGTNSASGSGSFTSLSSVSLTLSTGTVYHLKLVVNGTSHQAYLNDVLIISTTDSTYTAAGYVGLRLYNSSGSTQTGYFANFGIVLSLSGTWTSPAIDIHALGTISNSQIILQIDPGTASSIATFGVAISLNNGVSWTSCPNTLATPVISGAGNGQGYFQSLPVPGLSPGTNVSSYTQVLLQITITASTASTGLYMPDVQAISLFVVGPYSSTGTRSTAPLAWDSMNRLNVASGWGTATNGASYTQTGTGTTALTGGEATISNTTGDVHMRLGSGTQGDTSATCRVSLSASTMQAGIELRYSDANDFYRLAISTTTVAIVKVVGGVSITLASSNMTLSIGTYYRLHFIVQGSGALAPINLYGNIWQDGNAEPISYVISATD